MVNTTLQNKILDLLYKKSSSSLNQRRIASLLNVSAPAVMKALPKLKKDNLINISKDRESGRLSISLNWENTLAKKRVSNLKNIYESGLYKILENNFPGAAIVLFGSYSRGDDTESSDIDIAVIGRKEKQLNLKNIEKILFRKINLNFYGSWTKIHKNLKENICNGIILAGGVEL